MTATATTRVERPLYREAPAYRYAYAERLVGKPVKAVVSTYRDADGYLVAGTLVSVARVRAGSSADVIVIRPYPSDDGLTYQLDAAYSLATVAILAEDLEAAR